MALNLDQQLQLTKIPEFRSKVEQQLLLRCRDVLYSYNSVTYSALPDNQKQNVDTANAIIDNPSQFIDTVAKMVATDSGLNGFNPDDSTIASIMAAIFPDIAGIIRFDRTNL